MSTIAEVCSCGAAITVTESHPVAMAQRMRAWRTEHRHDPVDQDIVKNKPETEK